MCKKGEREEGRGEREKEIEAEIGLKAKGPREPGAEGTSCEDPIPGSVGGGPAGSSGGCFRCTPYQPTARCSDPMPMSEKSIVLGQGRGQREPQLHHGEGGWGPPLDLLTFPPPVAHQDGPPGEGRKDWVFPGATALDREPETCGGSIWRLTT